MEINHCPSLLIPGYSTYSPTALKRLTSGLPVSHVLPYTSLASNEVITKFNSNRKRMSLSGAQPKYSFTIHDDKFTLTQEGEQGRYILKPRLTDYLHPEFGPANEHLTMQIAEQVYGIDTVPNAICLFENDEMAYITRRYDVDNDGNKIQQEDFASLAGVSEDTNGKNYKYDTRSYEDIATLIKKYLPAAKIELVKFFDLMLFNFLFANGDAHLKNFSIIRRPDGSNTLSPAYDLINTLIHIPDDTIFALDKGLFSSKENPTIPTGAAFYEFGLTMGLGEKIVKKELTRFCREYPDIDRLIDASFLSNELKRTYRLIYRTRLKSYLQAGID